MPVLASGHWVTIDVDLKAQLIKIYNSYPAVAPSKNIMVLAHFLKATVCPEITVMNIQIKEQMDAVSCGVFAAFYLITPDERQYQLGGDEVNVFRILLAKILLEKKLSWNIKDLF